MAGLTSGSCRAVTQLGMTLNRDVSPHISSGTDEKWRLAGTAALVSWQGGARGQGSTLRGLLQPNPYKNRMTLHLQATDLARRALQVAEAQLRSRSQGNDSQSHALQERQPLQWALPEQAQRAGAQRHARLQPPPPRRLFSWDSSSARDVILCSKS